MENISDLEYEKLFKDFETKEKECFEVLRSRKDGLADKYREMVEAWKKVDEILQKIIQKD